MKKKYSTKNSAEPRLKYGYPLAERKTVITQFPSMGNHNSNSSKISQHNPPTKQLRRRRTEYLTFILQIEDYSLKTKQDTNIMR